MKHLIPILKKVELEIRAYKEIKSKEIWEELSNLEDWDYRIVQDFILRVNMAINKNDINFVYKRYEQDNKYKSVERKFDLLIASLRRDKLDTVLTDIRNRLIIPKELSWDILEIWGMQVTQARNLAVEKACEFGCKYLLFVDDDILSPNNALLQLYESMVQNYKYVVAANYYRKVEPLISAHGDIENHETNLCAMGFTLINIDEISKTVPFPLFWEFGAEDGYWSMGEDAFFTKNLIHYTGQKPLVRTDVECLHFDKRYKIMYGERKEDLTYASNWIENFDKFNNLRVPPKYPLINICIPNRQEQDPVAIDPTKLLLLRGYKSDFSFNYGDRVDISRTKLIKDSINKDSEFILFIDNDIIPPSDGLCKMLEHMKDESIGAVSGDYLLKGKLNHSIHLQLDKDGMVNELNRIEELEYQTLVQSNWLTGLGFCLIRTKCFYQMREPWFLCHSIANAGEDGINEDAHFTELMNQNGYKIMIDRTIKCGHVDFTKKIIYSYDEFNFDDYAYQEYLKTFTKKENGETK